MKLIVDIGNSQVKCYAFDQDDIVDKLVAVDLDQREVTDFVEKYDFKGVILSSTRGAVVTPGCMQKINRQIIFDTKTPIPIVNCYSSNTLGTDRLAAAVEVCARFPMQESIIFDFGTALTIDFVGDNKFFGGNISPGVWMRFQALNRFTKSLPMCHPQAQFDIVGNTTQSAIINGVMNSVWFEVEGYVEKNREKNIIFTGGEAKYFEKQVKITIFVDYELVPKGLNRILGYNEDI